MAKGEVCRLINDPPEAVFRLRRVLNFFKSRDKLDDMNFNLLHLRLASALDCIGRLDKRIIEQVDPIVLQIVQAMIHADMFKIVVNVTKLTSALVFMYGVTSDNNADLNLADKLYNSAPTLLSQFVPIAPLIKHKPEHNATDIRYSDILEKSRLYRKAAADIEAYVKVVPGDSELLVSLGVVFTVDERVPARVVDVIQNTLHGERLLSYYWYVPKCPICLVREHMLTEEDSIYRLTPKGYVCVSNKPRYLTDGVYGWVVLPKHILTDNTTQAFKVSQWDFLRPAAALGASRQ